MSNSFYEKINLFIIFNMSRNTLCTVYCIGMFALFPVLVLKGGICGSDFSSVYGLCLLVCLR